MHRSELAHISQAALTWLVQSGLISREEWNPFNGSMNKTDWSECLLPTLRSDSVDSKLKRCKLWLPMISICSASFICHLINLNILHPFSTKKTSRCSRLGSPNDGHQLRRLCHAHRRDAVAPLRALRWAWAETGHGSWLYQMVKLEGKLRDFNVNWNNKV